MVSSHQIIAWSKELIEEFKASKNKEAVQFLECFLSIYMKVIN